MLQRFRASAAVLTIALLALFAAPPAYARVSVRRDSEDSYFERRVRQAEARVADFVSLQERQRERERRRLATREIDLEKRAARLERVDAIRRAYASRPRDVDGARAAEMERARLERERVYQLRRDLVRERRILWRDRLRARLSSSAHIDEMQEFGLYEDEGGL